MSSPAISVAPDQVQAGELAKSGEQAFGLVLPRALRVSRRDFDLVVAEGSLPLDEALAYIRREWAFDAEAVDTPGITSFKRVVPRRPIGDWRGLIRVEASGDAKFTSLRIFGTVNPRRVKPASTAAP